MVSCGSLSSYLFACFSSYIRAHTENEEKADVQNHELKSDTVVNISYCTGYSNTVGVLEHYFLTLL